MSRPRDGEPLPEPAKRANTARSWMRVNAFWIGTGLCLFLGLGLAVLAFVVQGREKRGFDRKTQVEAELAALAAALQKHPSPPFRPDRAYLNLLAGLARIRGALAWQGAGEGNPDTDRQNFLEGELADLMRAYGQGRPAARDEAALAELRAAFRRAAAELERVRQASGLQDPHWIEELTQACAAVGLHPSVLVGFEARLGRVEEASQRLEEALGIALLDAQRLQRPGFEVVSFLPDAKRTTVAGGGWEASGFGQDARVPGRIVAFSMEGAALVHRLLNAGTWRSLARVDRTPHGQFRYTVDTATYQLSEHGSRHAEEALAAARALEGAWSALNPKASGLAFARVERKAFDDIFVELEPDAEAGTPDGKPDLDLWPTEGEIATVKDYFGPKGDLVVLRFPFAGAVRLQVLAREGLPYTNAGAMDDGQLVVLPGGLWLRPGEVRVPAFAGPQAFKIIQVMGRPRAKQMPTR